MKTNYRELCIELFGTDNEQELRKISKLVKQNNPRNAGRKRKYSEKESPMISSFLSEGALET